MGLSSDTNNNETNDGLNSIDQNNIGFENVFDNNFQNNQLLQPTTSFNSNDDILSVTSENITPLPSLNNISSMNITLNPQINSQIDNSLNQPINSQSNNSHINNLMNKPPNLSGISGLSNNFNDVSSVDLQNFQTQQSVSQQSNSPHSSILSGIQMQQLQSQGQGQTFQLSSGMTNNDMQQTILAFQQLSLPALVEKMQMVAMQMSQLKGQISAAQVNMTAQTKDMVGQMFYRLNYLQELYVQMVNIQQQKQQLQLQQQNQMRQIGMINPINSMISNNTINIQNQGQNVTQNQNFNMQQQYMQQYNQQKQQPNMNNIRAMQALQQRMMQVQMMSNQRMKMQMMNNMQGQIPSYMMQQQSQFYPMLNQKQMVNSYPHNQALNAYRNQMYMMNNNMVGNMGRNMGPGISMNRFSAPTGRRRRKRSETESSEFSSSPEPTRKEIDEMANNIGPLRRSTRAKKQKSYTFDIDDEDDVNDVKDEDENKSDKQVNVDDSNASELIPVQMTCVNDNNVAVIDKILADRIRTVKKETDSTLIKSEPDSIKVENELKTDDLNTENGIEEFYVKYKYYSYLHCEWLTLDAMKLKDRLAINKVKRYKLKKSDNIWQFTMDDEYFNPEYVEVDRILAKTTTNYIPDETSAVTSFDKTGDLTDQNIKTEDDNKLNDSNLNKIEDQIKNKHVTITHYLIKWCSLPYEDSTWEPEDLIDDDCIKEFEARENGPNQEKLQYIPRPNMSSWNELSQSPIYKENNILRNYQLEGLNWLRFCYYRWQNCILADEMGLGKTIQSIAFIQSVYDLGIKGPFLIIAPLSTIHNWYREFKTWTDINVVMFHGTANSRNIIHKYELTYNNTSADIHKFDALITTYEMILSELKYLSSIKWRVSVVDEAHRLKNKKCKLLESLSYLNIEHRVLLTGTPLQNSLEELYSLLSFLDPQNIPSEQAFMDEFGNLQSNEQVLKLQRVLKPIMLRRLKEDVEKNIAPKEETIIEVEMTSIQRRIYKSILEKNFSFLAKGTSTSNMPNLMNTMMELRKCCNHPFLIKGCEDKITSDFFSNDSDDMAAFHLRSLIESSGKMVLVDKLLPKLKANGHRILLFSQMVKVLDLIEDYLIQKKYLYERIDGSIRGNLRQAAIDRFSKPDSDRFIFLLCTKAGGLGINLTAADTVIIFDSDWNPQNDIQAQARCHRIGQSKSVKVYRLICRNSYEREMFDRASMKLGLDKAVLQNINNGGSKNETGIPNKFNEKQQLSKHDIEDLLKRGAYGALMDEDTAESAQFCAEDIDQILERRAIVVQITGESQGSSFAKASFQAGKKDDIDVDDPLFWEKWAQKAKLSVNKSNDLVYDTPRERKIINYDDPDAYYTDMESDVDLDDFDSLGKRSAILSTRKSWIRVECFKVEKQLLIFGWGRWDIITLYANFKTIVSYEDVINISRCIIAYCWHYAKVDVTTKSFIEGIIKNSFSKSNTNQDDDNDDFNYKPYAKTRSSRRNNGKKSKKSKDKQSPCAIEITTDWKSCDPDQFILDSGYRKHLQHNANKILLRIRLLYVLQIEIIGKTDELIMSGTIAGNIKLPVSLPRFTNNSLLSSWWNEDCDKSLLIGTFKHGYEKYKEMLLDTQLIFHELIPEDKLERFIKLQEEQLEAQLAKQAAINVINDGAPKKRGRKRKIPNVGKALILKRNTRNSDQSDIKDKEMEDNINDDISDFNSDDEINTQEIEEPLNIQDEQIQENEMSKNELNKNDDEKVTNEGISDEWPHASDLNTRFRRLVTSFWKSKKSGSTDKLNKKQKTRASILSDLASNGNVSIYSIRFSKKEENEFYKTVMQYGLEFDLTEFKSIENLIFNLSFKFNWDNFRIIRPFEKRSDDHLTMFAKYLVISCLYIISNSQDYHVVQSALMKNQNSIFVFTFESLPENFKPLEGITVEKAAKLLNRLDMMELLRNKIFKMEDLQVKMSCIPNDSLLLSDFPDWWKVGVHDYMLLRIVKKYGFTNSDQQIFFDNEFDLKNVVLDLYNIAREKQWINFLEQYSSPSDMSFEMLSALLKWPKLRVIILRVFKLLHYLIYGVWPLSSDIEERYVSTLKVNYNMPGVLNNNSQNLIHPINKNQENLNLLDTSFSNDISQNSTSAVMNPNLNVYSPSKPLK